MFGRRAMALAGLAVVVAGQADGQSISGYSPSATVRARWAPGASMTDALAREMDMAWSLQALSRYGFDDQAVCQLGGWFPEGERKAFRRTFRQGDRYVLVAAGNLLATDLEVAVRDGGQVVASSDSRGGSKAVLVAFTPTRTGEYVIEATLRRTTDGLGCFVGLGVLREGGYRPEIPDLAVALSGLESAGAAANQVRPMAYHEDRGQWAMFGSVLRQGQDFEITGLNLGDGGRVLVADGDQFSQDVDLFLHDSRGPVRHDDRTDRVAIVPAEAFGGESYRMRVHNHRSNGPSLVLAGLLKCGR